MMTFFRRWLGRQRVEAEMREEMEHHRALRIEDLMAAGATQAEAERTARLEFGSAENYKEECRAALGYRIFDQLRSDLRYAARGLRRSPGFSLTAIAILGLAIGANSAFFAIYNNYVRKPLAIRGYDRHFTISAFNAESRRTGGWTDAEARVLEQGAAQQVEGLYGGGTIQVLVVAPQQRMSMVTDVYGNYFELLGGVAAMGRLLTAADVEEPVTVLSDSGWHRLLPGVADPIGKTIRVRSTVLTVVGVTRPEFTGAEAVVPDFWVPSGMRTRVREVPPGDNVERRFDLAGLIRPGVSFAEAQQALTAAASHLDRPAGRVVARLDLQQQPSSLAGATELSVLSAMVFAAFLALLLIACANLANLYMARSAARTHELAMRLSLGATRWRIVRQLLTESTLTALCGSALGYCLAVLGIAFLQDRLMPLAAGLGMTVRPVTLDASVFAYTVALGALAGVAFGLLPSLEASANGLAAASKRRYAMTLGGLQPRHLRRILIGGQVAVSLVLLLVAAILVRNIGRLNRTDTGFDIDRVLSINGHPDQALLERLRVSQSVTAVSAVAQAPLYGRLDSFPIRVDGRDLTASYNRVDEGYFDTLAVTMTAGRSFTRKEAQTGTRVAVLSEATARRFWPGRSPLGRTFEVLPQEGQRSAGVYTVTGIVPDLVSGWIFQGKDTTAIYLPLTAADFAGFTIVRIMGNPVQARAAVRGVCADAGTGCEPTSLREVASMQRFPFQAVAAVAGVLGALALVLTVVGLHGVVRYTVIQRQREIGVHLALGARPGQVMRAVVAEAVWSVTAGLVVGLPVALVLSKLGSSTVLRVQTFDAFVYLLVPALLIGTAVVACIGPAIRASRVDPMLSLRAE